jgi:lipid-A-disaccharide synthase
MAKGLRIGIVAGESSGDILGAGLIKAIKQQMPDTSFEGIGGPLMMAEGFVSHFPMERLSVMGFVEPLKRLPELLSIRRSIIHQFIDNPPDLFVGIDSPDFTIGIELALRKKGILTAHYVSPSVWAWRKKRVFKIAKAVDRMLTLLPFEAEFYQQHDVPVSFVGHPLADQFPLVPDQAAAKKALDYEGNDKVIAVMPGSRGGEIRMLGEDFIATIRYCFDKNPALKFVIPAANEARKQQLTELIAEQGSDLPIQLMDGDSKTVMTAADVILMASGTTTLEAMLLKKPMVVAYRVSGFTYAIAKHLVNTDLFSLPNLLAGEKLVPEILQDDVSPETLGELILERLQPGFDREGLVQRFTNIHQQIRLNASEESAKALLAMIEERQGGKA